MTSLLTLSRFPFGPVIERWQRFLRVSAFLSAILAANGLLPGLHALLRSDLAALVLFLLYLCLDYFTREGQHRMWLPLAYLLGSAIGGAAVLLSTTPALRVAGLGGALLPIALGPQQNDRREHVSLVITSTIGSYVALALNLPAIMSDLERLAVIGSKALSHVSRAPVSLGASRLGLYSAGFFLSYFLAAAIASRPPVFRFLAVSTLSLIAGTLIEVVFLPPPSGYLAGLVSCAIVQALVPAEAASQRPRGQRIWVRSLAVLAVATVSAALIVVHTSGALRRGSILFLEDGYFDWTTPTPDDYRPVTRAQFGLLPPYLRTLGYQTNRISRSDLSSKLHEADTIVIISPQREFLPSERASLLRFVKGGKSLLLMGDHSDIAGIMTPINDLLRSLHIRLRFDSALPLNEKWQWYDGLTLPLHPATLGIVQESQLGISVGASLDVTPPARGVIFGEAAYSDAGDPARAVTHLGNMIRDPEEQLGGLVLVAEEGYGKGRVMVFGDTASFQNDSLFRTWPFMDKLFLYLCGRPGFAPRTEVYALLIMLGISLLLTIKVFPLQVGSTVLLGLLAGGMAETAPLWINAAPPASFAAQQRVAFLVNSYLPQFEVFDSSGSIQGFARTLARAGFLPFLIDDLSDRFVKGPKVIALVAPCKAIDSSGQEHLLRFLNSGGLLLLSAGWNDYSAVRMFLGGLGLSMEPLPLGTGSAGLSTPYLTRKGITLPGIGFHEAWALRWAADVPWESAADLFGHSAVAIRSVGQGEVVVIADSKFLLGYNLETSAIHHRANIDFVRHLIESYSFGTSR